MEKLQDKYKKEVTKGLMEKFSYPGTMAVPRMTKVVLNTGIGRLVAGKTGDDQKKAIEGVLEDMTVIAGQRAALAAAKKSIAGFKLRQGMPVGVRVTLRGKRMYGFLDNLIHVVLPRSRDFRGLEASSVDKQGNLTIGIKEHVFFPEISPDKVRNPIGLQITVSTTAKTYQEGLELFRRLGFPIK
ncbi:MAG: 50S ribosomal protein L5 [Candidatus Wildermuthbacteria bacterium]|nr:50S ribosomal protein L5 [Candidatus Wildermuthbacteria bacterium]